MRAKLVRLFCILLVAVAVVSCDTPSREFDSNEWKTGNSSVRGGMAQNLIDRKLLVGKTRSDIEALLGKPDYKDADSYDYKVITTARCRFIWECRLDVSLTDPPVL